MNKENRKMLCEGIKFLNKMGVKSENIMLVGSIALDMQGFLPNNRTAHDLDIIIKTDDESWGCFKLFAAIYDDGSVKSSYLNENNLIFTFGNIHFNIWRAMGTEKINGLKDSVTGVWVKPAAEILKVKKGYHRLKDLEDIQNIFKMILD